MTETEGAETTATPAHDARRFRDALGWFTTGVAVVTTRLPGGAPIGITVNSFSSVSLDPPLVLWCLDKKSDTLSAFAVSTHFTVNVLREEHQEISSRLSRKGDHSLTGLAVVERKSGCPALKEALAHFECEVEARHDAGDHVIMIGRVLNFDYAKDGRPLLYHRGGYQMLPPL
ncbi:MAG: flavin reductase family protein [Parvibaculum sp.]|uniref:flavin reductase family protein n=1 Tax=Parvibaculum sp. TaxID=2024848 RepID=UPI00271A0C0B|nr:flavin reductase family protein [Parvibaculum sp.]MDO8840165.1 flavin reductase family protein [Parvibaculum sp.]